MKTGQKPHKLPKLSGKPPKFHKKKHYKYEKQVA